MPPKASQQAISARAIYSKFLGSAQSHRLDCVWRFYRNISAVSVVRGNGVLAVALAPFCGVFSFEKARPYYSRKARVDRLYGERFWSTIWPIAILMYLLVTCMSNIYYECLYFHLQYYRVVSLLHMIFCTDRGIRSFWTFC